MPAASLASLADDLPALLDSDGVGPPIRDAIPDLATACRALDATPIGPSVEHGDLSPGQVIVGEMGPVILDWSDSTITHPFLAAASFLMDPADLPADRGRRRCAAMAGAYLGRLGRRCGRHGAPSTSPRSSTRSTWSGSTADRILPGLEQPLGDGADGPVGLGSLAAAARRPAPYPWSVSRQRIPDEVLTAAHERAAARAARDWAEADRLRGGIEAAGWKIVDRGTDFALTPAAPPDVEEDGGVRYGASANVPSRLDEPATGLATVVLIATDCAGRPGAGARRARDARAGRAPRSWSSPTRPSDEQAAALEAPAAGRLPVEVVWTSERLGHGAALEHRDPPRRARRS